MLTASQLHGHQRQPTRSLRPPVMTTPLKTGKRAAVFSWNTGGLTSPACVEFMHWAHTQQLDIILLQGTLWRDESTWSAYGLHIIQSGEAQAHRSYAGVITMISAKLCKKEAIAFSSPIPGRVLHVRFSIGDKALDVVNVYQHTDGPNPHRPKPMESRALLWSKLDQLLARLAAGNVLIVGGDFNCALPGRDRRPRTLGDEPEFQEIIRKHLCCSVRTQDKGPTFVGP